MADDTVIRMLVVDDEPLARGKIRAMVARDAEVEIVGECSNGLEALAAIQELAPDLVLLDVQMPEAGGFEVLEALHEQGEEGAPPRRLPLVIFVTAYDQYAVRAFEVHAFDYLLKPFDRERFEAALLRVKTQLARERAGRAGAREGGGDLDRRILALLEQIKAETRHTARLVVKTAGRVFFLDVGEIDWIEAEGNYVRLHAAQKSYLLRETISRLESRLDPKNFIRIHRSTVINLSRVRELQPWSHGEYRVILRDGTELTLSRNFRDNLQAALGNNL